MNLLLLLVFIISFSPPENVQATKDLEGGQNVPDKTYHDNVSHGAPGNNAEAEHMPGSFTEDKSRCGTESVNPEQHSSVNDKAENKVSEHEKEITDKEETFTVPIAYDVHIHECDEEYHNCAYCKFKSGQNCSVDTEFAFGTKIVHSEVDKSEEVLNEMYENFAASTIHDTEIPEDEAAKHFKCASLRCNDLVKWERNVETETVLGTKNSDSTTDNNNDNEKEYTDMFESFPISIIHDTSINIYNQDNEQFHDTEKENDVLEPYMHDIYIHEGEDDLLCCECAVYRQICTLETVLGIENICINEGNFADEEEEHDDRCETFTFPTIYDININEQIRDTEEENPVFEPYMYDINEQVHDPDEENSVFEPFVLDSDEQVYETEVENNVFEPYMRDIDIHEGKQEQCECDVCCQTRTLGTENFDINESNFAENEDNYRHETSIVPTIYDSNINERSEVQERFICDCKEFGQTCSVERESALGTINVINEVNTEDHEDEHIDLFEDFTLTNLDDTDICETGEEHSECPVFCCNISGQSSSLKTESASGAVNIRNEAIEEADDKEECNDLCENFPVPVASDTDSDTDSDVDSDTDSDTDSYYTDTEESNAEFMCIICSLGASGTLYTINDASEEVVDKEECNDLCENRSIPISSNSDSDTDTDTDSDDTDSDESDEECIRNTCYLNASGTVNIRKDTSEEVVDKEEKSNDLCENLAVPFASDTDVDETENGKDDAEKNESNKKCMCSTYCLNVSETVHIRNNASEEVVDKDEECNDLCENLPVPIASDTDTGTDADVADDADTGEEDCMSSICRLIDSNQNCTTETESLGTNFENNFLQNAGERRQTECDIDISNSSQNAVTDNDGSSSYFVIRDINNIEDQHLAQSYNEFIQRIYFS